MRTKPNSPVVIINGFSFLTKSTSKLKFELWSRLGNFKDYKGSLDGWEQIGKGSLKGEGLGQMTSLPFDKITPVNIPGGGEAAGTRAFYLTLLSKDLSYNFGEGTESDALIQIETPEIELWEGEVRCYIVPYIVLLISELIVDTLLYQGVLLYPMPDASESMYYRYPRQFLGSIYCKCHGFRGCFLSFCTLTCNIVDCCIDDRLPCRPYSAFGIISKLPCPELPTQSPSIPPPTLSPQTPAPTM